MTKRKILTYILIPILSVYLFICNLSIISFADVPSTQIVQSVSGNWTYNHSYGGLGKYFTIQDTTGLDSCSSLAPYFYYTSDNVTFKKLIGTKTIAYVLNKVVGIVVSPEQLQTFYNAFFSAINVTDENGHLQNGVYDSNDTFYGYALNDITGCYYGGNATGNVTIPSYIPNNVKIVVDNELDMSPPYIIYKPIPNTNILNNYSTYSPITSEQRTNFLNFCSNHKYVFRATWHTNYNFFSINGSSASFKTLYFKDSLKYIVGQSGSGNGTYKTMCDTHNLTVANNEISFGELGSSEYLVFLFYDENFERIYKFDGYDFSSNTTTTDAHNLNQSYTAERYMYLGHNPSETTYYMIQTPINTDYQIYKNTSVISALQDKSYRPSVYTTTNYINYNPSNDNSSDTSVSNIDNSVTNNETIYNSVDNSYSEYIDNSVIDNSSVINNTTNIVNNYYGSSSEGGEGGEGGSDSDGVLDRLLEGLLAFFNAIGRVLATVITGLLDMFTTVLDAIASLTTDLTGLTDFFGSLFGWMPEPIPQVLGIGISICILCAVIRFIRG